MTDLMATIRCPECNFEKLEEMPTNYWVMYYTCTGCGTVLQPKTGDCCVYCSYADKHCPSKQKENL